MTNTFRVVEIATTMLLMTTAESRPRECKASTSGGESSQSSHPNSPRPLWLCVTFPETVQKLTEQ